MDAIGRRALLVGASLASIAGCSRCDREGGGGRPPSSDPSPRAASSVLPPVVPDKPDLPESGVGVRGQVKTETWTLPGDGRAVAITPTWGSGSPEDDKLPLLVSLHGRGEALKGPALGVMGWPKDYALLRAIERVCAPPLSADDFEGFVEDRRLAAHNEALTKRQFAGLVILCPYSPDVDLRKPPQIREYGDYLMKVVLTRAKRDLPILGSPASIGIDGVSLGGALSLRIGLGNPEAFGAVGTLQPAIGEDQVPDFTELAKSARAKNPHLALRLLTSKEDYFRRAIKSTSSAWSAAGVEHDYEDLPGPHDYPFNRGPGAIEMLLWHDRRLSRA